jgi:hypothetical protein
LVGLFNIISALFSLFVGTWIALRGISMFAPARDKSEVVDLDAPAIAEA